MRPGARLVAYRIGTLLLALVAGAGWGESRANEEHLRDTSTLTATCLWCHPFTHSHPVDVDYEGIAASRARNLRSLSDVVRRGLFVPGGRVVCHTCHDANSHWGSKIVIPPGSKVTPRVIPGNPGTYDPGKGQPRTMAVEEARTLLARGYALSPKPLCLSCHALD